LASCLKPSAAIPGAKWWSMPKNGDLERNVEEDSPLPNGKALGG